MLTQCPECNTTFRLHVRQLQAAAGKVRCSRCHTAFNALDHLVEPSPPAEEPPPAPRTEGSGESAAVTTPPGETDALDALINELECGISQPDATAPDDNAAQPASLITTALDAINVTQEDDETGRDALPTTTVEVIREDDTAQEPGDTLDDLFEEAITTAEDEASEDITDDLFEEAITTAEGEVPEDTTDDLFEEAITTAEDEAPEDITDDLFEEAITTAEDEAPGDITGDLFEESLDTTPADDFATIFEESAAPDTADAPDAPIEEPVVDEALFDAFLDEVEPDIPYDTPLMDELVDEVATDVAKREPDSFDSLTQADMDVFFTEPATPAPDASPAETRQPGEALLNETPSDETPIESTEPPPPPAPLTSTAPPAEAPDPLAPFSEAQLESLLSPTEKQAAEEEALNRDVPHAPAELDLADEESPTVEESTPPPTIDYDLRAELMTQARPGSGAAPLLWGVGVVLLCAVLALQYLYYHRLQLVENPRLRPLLTALCELGDCQLPPRRDLGRIELRDHLMQFHPNYEQSLLLSATLANRAGFAQPYPLVEVVMTDIEQRVVARRRFPPAQYLTNYHEGDRFAANSEVALLLEVLDPGNQAVGFEFRFY
ncbi:MAG: zinc-ribbon domain-containing protein [Gammaproteobacteria bacterium]|nr:zinc-ribbon domain-containing protein [Gammaproteobacteria bacterium]